MRDSAVVLILLLLLGSGAALAEGKGKGHGKKQDQAAEGSVTVQFGDRERAIVRDYYGDVASSGKCPPGLAKKNNGCLPPGQAKKWAIGRPLPRDVVFYEVPSALTLRLPPPPDRHRYVRVAADILLIAVGTGLVVAAIEDLGRL